jgi:hypothetical protein
MFHLIYVYGGQAALSLVFRTWNWGIAWLYCFMGNSRHAISLDEMVLPINITFGFNNLKWELGTMLTDNIFKKKLPVE